MLEEFKLSSWGDFSKRYNKTFGWYLSDKGPKLLVQVGEVSSAGTKFYGAEGQEYFALPDKGNVFEFLPVERGLYNIARGVVLCQRVPARQWRRGLHRDNTQIKLMDAGSFSSLDITFDLLAEIFTAPDYDNAIQQFLKGKRVSVAFNSMFGCLKNGTFLLFGSKIGTYNKDVIELDSDLFFQEVSDLVRDKKLPYKVRLA